MTEAHGIVYAYETASALGGLTANRTSASLPIGGRYRLIDFTLSALVCAGVRDVGVIMQRDYQSLLDHLGSGKDWDLSRRGGGLRLLPPFGLPDSHTGNYRGRMEALGAVESYIRDIRQKLVILVRGNLCANVDLRAALRTHLESGAEVTAVCSAEEPALRCHRFFPGEDGFASRLLCAAEKEAGGLASLEIYIISKALLLEWIVQCQAEARLHFHRDAMMDWLARGGRVKLYIHPGYARRIETVAGYYSASQAMLDARVRASLFPAERPIRTKERADVSTYYGEQAVARNCLVADGCYIEGEVENCVLFRGVHVERGARLRGCVVMQDTCIGRDTTLAYVIADKNVRIGERMTLAGGPGLPLVLPKNSIL